MSHFPEVNYGSNYNYCELSEFLKECADRSKGKMSLESLVQSPGGRKVWLAAITDPETGAHDSKPAYYVQANLHAHEMYGTTAALRLIHALMTLDNAGKILEGITFYVVPRINPDGAEYALTTHGGIRSRNEIISDTDSVVPRDVNGDGMILNMRWEDPAGPFAVDPVDERLLVPRRPGDKGPFFHQCAEGLINEYGGGPLKKGVMAFDFNRNYPVNWSPKTDKAPYPFFHPETRAAGDFLVSRKNIFAGIDFHGGPAAILHPDDGGGGKVSREDKAFIREVGKLGERLSGITLRSAKDYRPSWMEPVPLPGLSTDFGHFGLGISWYLIELGNGITTAGVNSDELIESPREVQERECMRRMLAFADEHADTDSRMIFVPWEDFEHPQLGRVQIGGLAASAISAYPPEMERISAGTTDFILRHAEYHPQLMLSGCEAAFISAGIYRVRARAANVGRFPTNVMSAALQLPDHPMVRVYLEHDEKIKVLSQKRVFEFESVKGGGDFKPVEWFVSAPEGGRVNITASHPRAGICRRELPLAGKRG